MTSDTHNEKAASYGPAYRIFLMTAAFLAGAAIMIVELAGNRILAPWFGNSLYTWTGLIGVVLLSVSLGYYLGGYIADRLPSWSVLCHLMFAGSLLTIAIPFSQSVLEGLMNKMGLVSGPVIASLCLFALPGILFASVTPFAIRLMSLLSGDRRVGSSAGKIGMLGTFGSVLGTFASGFLLIPRIPLHIIFLGTGTVVAIVALLGYVMFSHGNRRTMGTALIAILCVAGVVSVSPVLLGKTRPPSVLFDEHTFYHRVRVIEHVDDFGRCVRMLHLDSTVEGGQYIDESHLPVAYQRFWELSRALTPGLQRALFLGGGAFGMPEALLDSFPKASVDVVELDPRVIEVGREFFRVGNYPALNPIAGDARRFLNTSEGKYDFIFGDAYNGLRYIPAHLVTREFFTLLEGRLEPDGVFLMNIISSIEGDNSELFVSIFSTLSEVFDDVSFFASHLSHPEASQNIILVAAKCDVDVPALIRGSSLSYAVKRDFLSCHVAVEEGAELGGTVLSDSFNPVEAMVARALLRESGRW